MKRKSVDLQELCRILRLRVPANSTKPVMSRLISHERVATSKQLRCLGVLSRIHRIEVAPVPFSSKSKASSEISRLKELFET